MYAGSVLKRLNGLNYQTLAYFVRAGYIKPKRVRRSNLYYNDFSEEDIELIRNAWDLICHYGMNPKAAFQTLNKEARNSQALLDFARTQNPLSNL